jgi:hypothetical protein
MAKTQRERDADARKVKLDRIDEQVRDGSLTIRKMSSKERAAWAGRKEELEASQSPADRKKADAANARRQRRRERSAS